MTSSIAVIITTKNRPTYVAEAIESVINQTKRASSIVIVDDGSDTPIADQLNPSLTEHCAVIRNEKSAGVSAARNQGVEAASAEWIVFLDDDDWIDPDFVQSIDLAINEQCAAKIFWPSRLMVNEATGKTKSRTTPAVAPGTQTLSTELMASLMETGCSGTTVHKTAFESVEGFDESLIVSEDRDLTFRLLAAGFLALPVEHAVINIRVHEGPRLSSHEKGELQAKSDLKAIEKNLEFLKSHPVLAEKFLGRAAKRMWERNHKREARYVIKLLAGICPYSIRVRQRQLKWLVASVFS